MGKDLFLIFFGAALGFGFAYLTEWRRRLDERKDKAERSKQIALDVSLEALQGIKRCVNLTKGISQKPASVSFGRIYTAFWDSVKDELARDLDPFHQIHWILIYGEHFGIVTEKIPEIQCNRRSGN